MSIVQKSKKGTSLVEVMTAVLISTIVILGGSFFYVDSTNQINIREQHRAACRFAGQKLEELKAGSYDDVTIGEANEKKSAKRFHSLRTYNCDVHRCYCDFSSRYDSVLWSEILE